MDGGQQVLVLDDDRDSGQLVRDVAEGLGLGCLATTDPMTFLESVTKDAAVVFLDLVMPYSGGIELLEELSRMRFGASIVLMSGADPRTLDATGEWAKTLGLKTIGYLHKPFSVVDLEEILRRFVMPPG
jgi:CheY-like chemotaxis protein